MRPKEVRQLVRGPYLVTCQGQAVDAQVWKGAHACVRKGTLRALGLAGGNGQTKDRLETRTRPRNLDF